MKIGLVTLGCSKNQVDSEMILGFFTKKSFEITNTPELADIIVINTCGFINSAKEESINTILEMCDYKKKSVGICKAIVVTGCLAKRYKSDIEELLPEVDLTIGVDEYNNIEALLENLFTSINVKSENVDYLDFNNRVISTVFPMAYLRISDGCDNRCSYCAIPLIRGGMKSRKIEDILEEANNLVNKGVKELVIISQDTSRYGLDIYNKYMLSNLLNELAKIKDLKWIRVLYMYPSEITDELIDTFTKNDKICNYFDIPIQHICDKILLAMNRRGTKQDILNVITKIRAKIPDAIIRTTIMVGFPGETDEDFNELISSIKEIKFDRLGCFTFSKEKDTKAYSMKGLVPKKIANQREKELMTLQESISKENNSKYVGKTFEVIIEGVSDDEKHYVCRSYMEAPDVDGRIYLEISKHVNSSVIIGNYYKVKITDYNTYDLFGKLEEI